MAKCLIGGVEGDKARRERKVTLRVEVDQQDVLPSFLQSSSEIQRAGGLAHPTLLIGYCDDWHAAASLPSLLAQCRRSLGTPEAHNHSRLVPPENPKVLTSDCRWFNTDLFRALRSAVASPVFAAQLSILSSSPSWQLLQPGAG